MKKFFKAWFCCIMVWVSVVAVMLLCTYFSNLTFNIREWDGHTRELIAGISAFLFSMTILAAIVYSIESRNV